MIKELPLDIFFSIVLGASFGVTASYVSIIRNQRPVWKTGMILLLACMEICITYVLRGLGESFQAQLFWYKMSFMGFIVVGSSFFIFVLQYISPENGFNPPATHLLSVVPAITAILVLTNEVHGLIWDPAKTQKIMDSTIFPAINEAGIGYWFYIIYMFFVTGLGCFILIRWVIQSKRYYSRLAVWIIIAAIAMLSGSALHIFQLSPFRPLVTTGIGLSLGTISITCALVPLRWHDIVSIDQQAIVNNVEECIIVIDGGERIALVNPAAEKLIGDSGSSAIGKPLHQVLPGLKPISVYLSGQSSEAVFTLGDVHHTFSLRISPINDWKGKTASHLIVLHDITEYKQAETRILNSESKLAEAQRISHIGSWEWNSKSNGILCSEEMFRIAGLLPEAGEITFETFKSFLHHDEAEKVIQVMKQEAGDPVNDIEHLIVRPNGEVRQVLSRIRAYRDENGKPLLILGTVQDITERKQVEEQVRLQATALESAINGIMITDVEGNILWANPSLIRMTGYTAEEFNARKMSLFDYGPKDPNVVREIRDSISNNASWTGEVINSRNDGTEYIVDMTMTPVTGQNGEIIHYVSISQDISEKIEAKRQLEYMATHDSLTGLPNRLLFKDRLNHALTVAKRTGHQGAIFFVDLDNFKSINDVFSHTIGDELLILLAKRIQSCLRESDTVARIGGDEFAILLEDIDQFNVDIVAQKVIKAVAVPAKIKEATIIITTSIGISFFPQDGETIPVLMKNADLAMYQAKEKNKNTFEFFNQEMASKIKGQMDLLTYLRFALRNDIFELFYQPKVNSETGRVIGAEALLRLPHPTRDWIPPSEFVPLAEKTDIILHLDEWVIRTACRKKRDLLTTGLPDFNLSLNISNHQLGQANLIAMLKRAISENNLDPAFLELEISESSAFQDVDVTIKMLDELKTLGIKIAIDDFGKGYSSLSYLANFPLDVIKIDLSFAQRIPQSTNDVGIVKGIIAIAKSLGVTVVVEGVENKEQLDFFMDNGCKYVQGQYFSPAVSWDELAKILRTGFG